MSTELEKFLKTHRHIKGKNNLTHTRIPNPTLNIYGGSFSIEGDVLDEFNQLYYIIYL